MELAGAQVCEPQANRRSYRIRVPMCPLRPGRRKFTAESIAGWKFRCPSGARRHRERGSGGCAHSPEAHELAHRL